MKRILLGELGEGRPQAARRLRPPREHDRLQRRARERRGLRLARRRLADGVPHPDRAEPANRGHLAGRQHVASGRAGRGEHPDRRRLGLLPSPHPDPLAGPEGAREQAHVRDPLARLGALDLEDPTRDRGLRVAAWRPRAAPRCPPAGRRSRRPSPRNRSTPGGSSRCASDARAPAGCVPARSAWSRPRRRGGWRRRDRRGPPSGAPDGPRPPAGTARSSRHAGRGRGRPPSEGRRATAAEPSPPRRGRGRHRRGRSCSGRPASGRGAGGGRGTGAASGAGRPRRPRPRARRRRARPGRARPPR